MSLTTKQKGVLTGMLSGLFIAFFTLAYAAVMNPLHHTVSLSLADRLVVLMRTMVCLAFFLGLSIARLARHRFFSPEDIDGSGLSAGSKKAKILQAELQNTLEQVMLAMPVYFAWLTLMPVTWLSVLPVAAVLFFFGRFSFMGGAPPYRLVSFHV